MPERDSARSCLVPSATFARAARLPLLEVSAKPAKRCPLSLFLFTFSARDVRFGSQPPPRLQRIGGMSVHTLGVSHGLQIRDPRFESGCRLHSNRRNPTVLRGRHPQAPSRAIREASAKPALFFTRFPSCFVWALRFEGWQSGDRRPEAVRVHVRIDVGGHANR